MNKVILSAAVIAVIACTSCKKEVKTETEITTETPQELAMTDVLFGVRGNCDMCKTTIEKAANAVEGVAMANWDVDKKNIEVSFDDTKTNEMSIHNAIAASGYDTEKVPGSEQAYNDLPACCQYDRDMTMNQSGEEPSKTQMEH